MKTSAELQAEIAVLTVARDEANVLVTSLPNLKNRIVHLTAAAVVSQDDSARRSLEACQQELEDAVAAVSKRDALNQALGEAQNLLDYTKGREREAHCESVRSDFMNLFGEYCGQSKSLLATFRELQRVSNQHAALTGRILLESDQLSLYLPAVDPDCNPSIPHGRR
jgi:hypothetical protein